MTAVTTNLLLLLLLFCLPANAQRHAVVIHEIMADPQPSIGLPEVEYIELRNRSAAPINLQGWRLQTGSSTSGAFPIYLLQPDSLVVVCSRTNAVLFGQNTIGVTSFPALSNGGTTLVLVNGTGSLVHAVPYTTAWYGAADKEGGGWSLEMIDAENPCGGAFNWRAAQHPLGGTPGGPNSVAGKNRDDTPPALLSATAPDSLHLLLRFDEALDSAAAANAHAFEMSTGISIVAAAPQPPLCQQVLLTLQKPMQISMVYTVKVQGVQDCTGNVLGSRSSVPAGLPQTAMAGDVVINEVLFNPKPGGSDYVELYNRGKKIIDLSGLSLTHSSTTAIGSQLPKLTKEPHYLFPGQHVVVAEDRDAVLRHFLVKNEALLLEVAALPSMPDDNGSITLWTEGGQIVDALAYHHNWHFALLTEKDGVALERINPAAPTQQSGNWTSAAATAGFGTPTYANSQLHQQSTAAMTWSIAPQVFSPDGDGFEDFCTITYQLDAPNYVANLQVFDAGGRLVRRLVQNQTLTQTGSFRWNGLSDAGSALPTGNYILLIEIFNLQGKKQQWKQTVVLARRR